MLSNKPRYLITNISVENNTANYTKRIIIDFKFAHLTGIDQASIFIEISQELAGSIAYSEFWDIVAQQAASHINDATFADYVVAYIKEKGFALTKPLVPPPGAMWNPEGIKPTYEAFGLSPSEPDIGGLVNCLPGLNEMVEHPVTGEFTSLKTAIINLNDKCGWSREKIADWLEEISDPDGITGPDLYFKIKEEV